MLAGKGYGTVHVKMVEAFHDPRWGLVVILTARMGGTQLGYSVYMAACSEEEAREFLPALTEHFGAEPVQASLS
jgi:hypothetical protein